MYRLNAEDKTISKILATVAARWPAQGSIGQKHKDTLNLLAQKPYLSIQEISDHFDLSRSAIERRFRAMGPQFLQTAQDLGMGSALANKLLERADTVFFVLAGHLGELYPQLQPYIERVLKRMPYLRDLSRADKDKLVALRLLSGASSLALAKRFRYDNRTVYGFFNGVEAFETKGAVLKFQEYLKARLAESIMQAYEDKFSSRRYPQRNYYAEARSAVRKAEKKYGIALTALLANIDTIEKHNRSNGHQGYFGNLSEVAVQELEAATKDSKNYTTVERFVSSLIDLEHTPVTVRYFNLPFKHAPPEGFIWANQYFDDLVIYFSSEALFHFFVQTFGADYPKAVNIVAFHEYAEFRFGSHDVAESMTQRAFGEWHKRIQAMFASYLLADTPLAPFTSIRAITTAYQYPGVRHHDITLSTHEAFAFLHYMIWRKMVWLRSSKDREAYLEGYRIRKEEDLNKSYQFVRRLEKEGLDSNIQSAMVVGSGLEMLPVLLALTGREVVFVDKMLEVLLLEDNVETIKQHLKYQYPNARMNLRMIQSEFASMNLDAFGISPNRFDLITMIDLVGPESTYTTSPLQWLLKSQELLKSSGFIYMDNRTDHQETLIRYLPDVFPQHTRLFEGQNGMWEPRFSNDFYRVQNADKGAEKLEPVGALALKQDIYDGWTQYAFSVEESFVLKKVWLRLMDQSPRYARRKPIVKNIIARLRSENALGQNVEILTPSQDELWTTIMQVAAEEKIAFPTFNDLRIITLASNKAQLGGKEPAIHYLLIPMEELESLDLLRQHDRYVYAQWLDHETAHLLDLYQGRQRTEEELTQDNPVHLFVDRMRLLRGMNGEVSRFITRRQFQLSLLQKFFNAEPLTQDEVGAGFNNKELFAHAGLLTSSGIIKLPAVKKGIKIVARGEHTGESVALRLFSDPNQGIMCQCLVFALGEDGHVYESANHYLRDKVTQVPQHLRTSTSRLDGRVTLDELDLYAFLRGEKVFPVQNRGGVITRRDIVQEGQTFTMPNRIQPPGRIQLMYANQKYSINICGPSEQTGKIPAFRFKANINLGTVLVTGAQGAQPGNYYYQDEERKTAAFTREV